ncbi:MAG: hypothetical protein Q4B26_11970 [Eubacteriales bacterium]|nr:hypothetical protein [Eubacteriales bacterium]
MKERAKEMIESIENHIKWATEDLNEAVERFQAWAAKADAYSIATFGESEVRRVAEARKKLEKYYDEKEIIEHLMRTEED